MDRVRNWLAAAGLLMLLAGPVFAAPVNTGHLTAELVAQTRGVAPGGTLQAALRQDIQKGWHTYWRNSGDSGAATELTWTLPTGWTAGELQWAPPARLPIGPLMNYGYEDKVLLPFTLKAPKTARPGETVTLKAHASFLVCADVCVPEDADLVLDVPVVAAAPEPDSRWGGPIAAALDAVPRADGATAAVSRDKGRLRVAVVAPTLKGADMADAYFFPYRADLIDHAKPQAVERGPSGLTLTLVPAVGHEADALPDKVEGVFEVAGKAYEVSALPGPPPAEAVGLGAPPVHAAPAKAAPIWGGLAGAMIFAFLGGLILNLMPCVFPILAMKATSLAAHAHSRRAGQAQGLAFLAGVLATFLGLAAVLIAVRAGGSAVGWGFQLQSPPVVAGLSLLMLGVALNLSGLFEVGASLQGLGAEAASRGGLAGAFLTGALAVVVAAPCTAPFMAPALGWALTQPVASSLAVFLGLGLGFAAPFTLAAFAPALMSRLPKPGGWMEGFRKLMAFPMYGTAAWLAWVLVIQSGPDALARLFAAAVVLALAAWLLGIAQRRHAQGGRPVVPAALGFVLLAGAAASVVWPSYAAPATETSGGQAEGSAIPYQPYTPQALSDAQAAGKPVFINYTAAWCVTCQVNERVAFSTSEAAAAFKRSGAVYLKADWTRRDAGIAADLAKFGRAGVPLYLVYPARGGSPEVLPQLLTPQIVARALDRAAGGA